jgi:hypothetical protein
MRSLQMKRSLNAFVLIFAFSLIGLQTKARASEVITVNFECQLNRLTPFIYKWWVIDGRGKIIEACPSPITATGTTATFTINSRIDKGCSVVVEVRTKVIITFWPTTIEEAIGSLVVPAQRDEASPSLYWIPNLQGYSIIVGLPK